MTLNVWIPPEFREPTGHCNVCGEDLYGSVGEMSKHLAACARENIDTIRAAAPSQKWKGGAFDPEVWDPEVAEHMRQVGERMKREGRLTVKPNEKAGFA